MIAECLSLKWLNHGPGNLALVQEDVPVTVAQQSSSLETPTKLTKYTFWIGGAQQAIL